MKRSYANRGKAFQLLINHANRIYKYKGLAVVDEVATPVKNLGIIGKGQMFKAVYEKKSTVDYYGVCNGSGIAFDAKSTNINTSFPLKNVHEHQVEYLKMFQDQGGEAFLLIEFEGLREIYFMPFPFFFPWWQQQDEKQGRKSIPYEDIKRDCLLVKPGRGVPIDYLKYVRERAE